MLKNPYHIFAKFLVGYVGLIQLFHFVVLVRAALLYSQAGKLGFPASPPQAGWHNQATPFLLATGAVDAVNVIFILLFVFAYFCKKWWWRPLGIMTMSIFVYSAVLYVAGAMTSGAWQLHIWEYLSVVIALLPTCGLLILFLIWGMRRAFWFGDEETHK
jgi:hypothetical protein